VPGRDLPQDPELWSRRSASFGAAAREYAEHRPDYSPSAVAWALAAGHEVLDLGAGTGPLTSGLVALGADVVAVEPDPLMLAELHARVPGAHAVAGAAEAIPLPDGSVDLVAVGTAYHWFDEDRALPEIHRVLRPGGRLALFYNWDDTERGPWLAGLDEVKRTSASHRAPDAHEDVESQLPRHPWLGRWELRRFAHAQRRTADSMVATVGTESHTLVVPPDERAETLARVRAYLAAQPETAEGEFDRPLLTLVARTTVQPPD
jgi:SAM-dependent methyltransferase